MHIQESRQVTTNHQGNLLARLQQYVFKVHINRTYHNGVELPETTVCVTHQPVRGQLIREACVQTDMQDIVRGPVYSTFTISIPQEDLASIDAKLKEAKKRISEHQEWTQEIQTVDSASAYYAQRAVERIYTIYEAVAKEQPVSEGRCIPNTYTTTFTQELEELLTTAPKAMEQGYARLQQANKLMQQKHYESTIITAQTAMEIALKEFLMEHQALDTEEAKKGKYRKGDEEHKIIFSFYLGKRFDQAVRTAHGYYDGSRFFPGSLKEILIATNSQIKPITVLRNKITHQGQELRNPYLANVVLAVAKETIALCGSKGRTEGVALPYYDWLKETYVAMQQGTSLPLKPPYAPATLQSAKYFTIEELLHAVKTDKLPSKSKAFQVALQARDYANSTLEEFKYNTF